jgi:heavy metal translocating P-type ATPase
MKYIVASDIPGRLRLRFGRGNFIVEQEYALEAHFSAVSGVVSANANSKTGSVLLRYSGVERELLLRKAKTLISGELELLPAPIAKQNLLDDEFKRSIAGLVLRHFARRYLLPAPVRAVMTVIRAVKFWRRGLDALRRGRLEVEVLDAAAIGASISQGNYDTASSIMLLLRASELLEAHTLQRTKMLLSDSLTTNADTVWVERGGVEIRIPASELSLGDVVIVRAGSAIPVDGTVRSGEALVNSAAMTGEPLGVFKKSGDTVFAGAVVEDGKLSVEVRALDGETRVNQILELISRSETLKAASQSRAERIADKLVPFSFLLSAAVFAVTRNVTKALSVLLVDYSCAIKLATPIAILSAMREASELGIVVKGGKFLEAVATADTIIFDKTGTLTLAEPKVSRVTPFDGFERDEVLRLAACMEEHFPHSVARAIVRAAVDENLRHEEEHTEVEYIVAHGIATHIHGRRAIIGSGHFVFDDEKVPLTDAQRRLIDGDTSGDSVICLAVDGALAGLIHISDPPRAEAARAIAGLRELGIKHVAMLTGDAENAAQSVSAALGIDSYMAQILPEDKAEVVKTYRRNGHSVIMVGDGINDSPALAAADVSVAMRDASDLAREVADITLLGNDLTQLVTLRKLGIAMMKRVDTQFGGIVGFNSGVLLGGLTGVITPGASALLHNLFTVAVSAAGTRKFLR